MLGDDRETFQINARRRLMAIGAGLSLAFVGLGGRLFHLQILKGGAYRDLADDNRISLQPIPAPRGRILDNGGNVLVDNSPDYRLAVIPELANNLRRLLQRLQPYLGLEETEIRALLDSAGRQRAFLPLRVKSHLTWEQLSQIQSRIHTFPGIIIQVHSQRHYLRGDLLAHVLGYLGDVSTADRSHFPGIYFRSGDLVGKTGLERAMETELRGREGLREMEVNAAGRQIRELRRTPPEPGKDLLLTLDMGLQQVAEKALEGVAGAVVAMVPHTGEILAMANRPSFDPNKFIQGFSRQEWQTLISDIDRPLTNKAIQGQYPPGSTFKIVVTLAALAEGKLAPEDRFFCRGHITRKDHRFYCWRNSGHGEMDLTQALAQSCDVYFYRLSERIGIDAIERQALRMGLGSLTGIRLSGERPGLVPSREWKRAVHQARWYPGETLITAIGQGYMLATPLQLVRMIATVANGGMLHRPTLIRRELKENLRHSLVAIDDPSHLPILQRGLEEVMHGRLGTARKAQIEGVRSAGKTGTSQVARHRRKENGELIQSDNYRLKDHALFVTYAPTEKPEIALSVLIEHGGGGGGNAAPVAKRVLDHYFATKKAADGTGMSANTGANSEAGHGR